LAININHDYIFLFSLSWFSGGSAANLLSLLWILVVAFVMLLKTEKVSIVAGYLGVALKPHTTF